MWVLWIKEEALIYCFYVHRLWSELLKLSMEMLIIISRLKFEVA